jgi:hypothetical protein
MRRILLAVTLLWAASARLEATEALIFDGGGYNVQILVGMTERPVVASVRFTAPGAKDWVSLPRDLVRVEKFDFGKRLIMHFSNPKKDPALPGPFSLSVTKENAVLSIGGKKIKSTIQWDI